MGLSLPRCGSQRAHGCLFCGQWVQEQPEPLVQSHSSQQQCQVQFSWGGS